MDSKHYDYAIIGTGIGGLTLAALLAHSGKKVIAFEQHSAPGGFAHTFRKGAFSFCAPHYLWECGPEGRVTRVLKKLGLDSSVRFRQINPSGFDRVIGPEVDYSIGCGANREWQRLSQMFPGHTNNLKRYFDLVDKICDQMYLLPIEFDWRSVAASPLRYSHILRYVGWTLENLFDDLGFPPDLRLLLAGQSAIFWLPPRDLSLLVHCVGVGSLSRGAYYPERGFGHVIASLQAAIDGATNCRVVLSTEVKEVRIQGKRARSVVTSAGDSIDADYVICNADPRVIRRLVNQEHLPESFQKKLNYEYGASAFTLYLGLKPGTLNYAGVGEANLSWYPMTDLNQVYDQQLADKVPGRPFIFCSSPSQRSIASATAPPEHDQLVAVSPCRYELFASARETSERDYQALKQLYADRMIGVLEAELVPELSLNIVERVTWTPLTIENRDACSQGKLLRNATRSGARSSAKTQFEKSDRQSLLHRRQQQSAWIRNDDALRQHALHGTNRR